MFLLSLRILLTTSIALCSYNTIANIESNIPEFGGCANSTLPVSQERQIAEMIMQKIQGSDFIVSDPVVNEYLEYLSKKFRAVAPTLDFKLQFFGVDSDEFNAFAFFGAHVAVHKGLISAVRNESELAAVLAHETAHVTQHHLARILNENQKMMPLTIVELLAAAAIGALASPEAGYHLATAAMAGHTQNLINYTREHEKEADRIGISILAKTGFDPSAMATVFHGMQKKNYYRSEVPEYLTTHPFFENRINDAASRAGMFEYKQTPDSLLFHLVRVRLDMAKKEKSIKKLQRYQGFLASGRCENKIAAEYGYALALLNCGKAREARIQMEALEQRYPEEWIFGLGIVEIEQQQGRISQALTKIKQLSESNPNNQALLLHYCSLLLDNKEPSLFFQIISTHYSFPLQDPVLQQMVVKAHTMMSQPIACHRAQAEWHYLRGEFKDAARQLDIASNLATHDAKILAQLKNRKDELKKIEAEQKKLGI